MITKEDVKRFWKKVQKSDGCWEWTGAVTSRGYGNLTIRGKCLLAHRFSFEIAYGVIRKELEVCHKCDNPLCVRPDHLFLGTHLENMTDAVQKGRYRRGSGHGISKLNETIVAEARARSSAGVSVYRLAKDYGVDFNTMWKAVRGLTWTHVK